MSKIEEEGERSHFIYTSRRHPNKPTSRSMTQVLLLLKDQ
jgi:hypothetical protein